MADITAAEKVPAINRTHSTPSTDEKERPEPDSSGDAHSDARIELDDHDAQVSVVIKWITFIHLSLPAPSPSRLTQTRMKRHTNSPSGTFVSRFPSSIYQLPSPVQSLSGVSWVLLVCLLPPTAVQVADIPVVGASNIYLGLKTGFTFGPQLFGVSVSVSDATHPSW
jgi:hypothetical protein